MTSPTTHLTLSSSFNPEWFHTDHFDRKQLNPRREKTRILSADDDPLVLHTRRAILELAGYEVLNAADGREALQIFAEYPIDLAILDYRMPEVDGGAVARELKRCRPELPIILISGGGVDESAKDYADCLIVKGRTPTFMLGEIERLLASARASVSSTAD
ncbi:MAG TPA: response regulator [Terracidiphilus sp.]|nr:response regulator [Terracidiphilus sp.]